MTQLRPQINDRRRATVPAMLACVLLGAMAWSANGVERGAGVEFGDEDMLQCRLMRETTANGVELRGLVTARGAVRGRYELTLSKRDAAGSTRQRQGGRFVFDGPGEKVVSVTRVSLVEGGRLEASLVLSGEGFETVCASIEIEAPGDGPTET